MTDEGYASPEEAGRGDQPEQFVKVLGIRIDGDQACVWSLTNDRPPFEEDELFLERRGSRWFPTHGWGGWTEAPAEVHKKAARLGHRGGGQTVPRD